MSDESIDICTLARQAALAKRETDCLERDAFVRSIVADAFTRNDDGTYTICGYQWKVEQCVSPRLTLTSNWKGLHLDPLLVYSFQTFGEQLLKIDAQVKRLEALYPDTWWGRCKLRRAIAWQNDPGW